MVADRGETQYHCFMCLSLQNSCMYGNDANWETQTQVLTRYKKIIVVQIKKLRRKTDKHKLNYQMQ